MKELELKSIIIRKKPKYQKGHVHKIFENKVNRKFQTSKPNEVWLTDFTYLKLSNGAKRYNCTIIDLYDRSVIATLNGKNMTSNLAIKTMEIALSRNKYQFNKLTLHSDQGSQYTSKEFTDFCERKKIVQSMSKAGCPYDNAPMERYFNSMKNEFYNLFVFKNDEALNAGISDYAYAWYNHTRPHFYNDGKTPFEARKAA